MANFSSGACNEYRVSLRCWIRKHLNNKTFHNFEWLKIDTEPEVELFKIPWVDQDKPGFKDLLDICKAWAKNKDGHDSEDSPSKLKSRLRDALRNAHFFKKREDLSCMGQQTGDYVVYQYLSPAEEKKKKDKLKQKSPSESSTPSVPSSQESYLSHSQTNGYLDDEAFMNLNNLCSTLPARVLNGDFGLENLENSDVCQNYSPDLNLLEFDPLATQGPDSFANGTVEVPSSVSPQHNLENVSTNTSEPMPRMPIQDSHAPANLADLSLPLDLKTLLDAYQVPIGFTPQIRSTNSEDADQVEKSTSSFATSHKCKRVPPLPTRGTHTDNFIGATSDNLTKFNVTLKYKNEIIQSFMVDFADESWFFPENAQPLAKTTANNVFLLPRYSNEVANVRKILDGCKDGFALRIFPQYDEKQVLQDLCLYGLRKCQSHIYFLNSQNNETSQKIEKNEEVCLFSYCGYIGHSFEYKARQRSSIPKCEVLLVLGTSPTSPLSPTFVSLSVEPVIAETLERNLDCSDSNISLRFSSDPDSFGDAIQQLCSSIEANRPPVSFEEMVTS